MSDEIFNVLFLCTGNSARSILAEVILNHVGKGRFRAFSGGSHPKDRVHPLAIELLQKNSLPTEGLRSKDWSEFSRSDSNPDVPEMDFVFTVCDKTAGEMCPVWPGQPMTVHWGVHDPAEVEGTDEQKRNAFFQAYNQLQRRISLFVSLPFEKLDRIKLQAAVREIGKRS